MILTVDMSDNILRLVIETSLCRIPLRAEAAWLPRMARSQHAL